MSIDFGADYLRREWTGQRQEQSASIEWWDSHADNPHYREIPDIQQERFLKLMRECGALHADARILDIGCGMGAYAIALSPCVRSVHGIDLSPRMVQEGEGLVKAHGVENVTLEQADWKDYAIPKPRGKNEAYDLVYSHMTPAIACAADLQKMIDASSRFGFICRPAYRVDSLRSELDLLCGKAPRHKGPNAAIALVFAYLWSCGFLPHLSYEERIWEHEDPVDLVYDVQCKRLSLDGAISREQRQLVQQYLNERASNGRVHYQAKMLIATIYWDKHEQHQL